MKLIVHKHGYFTHLQITLYMFFAVSMGGAAGLFVGASLLSFVEIIYYFTIRLFVTVKRKYRQHNQTPDISLGTNVLHPN
jgi:amiloride-sensitive sodium channel